MGYPIRPAMPFAKCHTDNEIQDTVVVGDGFVGKMQSASIMNRIQKLPEKFRGGPGKERDKFQLMMIGSGDGRAFKKGRGHTGTECVNLRRDQMSYRAGNTSLADDELLKMTADVEEMRFKGQKPIAFSRPYTDPGTGINYSLLKEKDEAFSLEYFVQKYYPDKAGNIDTERFILDEYSHYFVDKEVERTPDVNFKSVDGKVTDVEYDPHNDLFRLTVSDGADKHPRHILARHVVMATGLEGDIVPDSMKKIADKPNFFSGERLYRDFAAKLDGSQEHANTVAELKKKRGLFVGTGLSINEIAGKMLDNDIKNFCVVSRHGLTHGLPRDLPPLPELQETIDEIYDLFDRRLRKNHVHDEQPKNENSYVTKIRLAVSRAAAIALSYKTNNPHPVEVRGKLFDRQALCRSLLLQYVLYKYEKRRGELRELIGVEDAIHLAAQMYTAIDRPGMSWITTARTSTTEHNMEVADYLRKNDMLMAAEIKEVVSEGEGFRVHFAQQERTFDNSEDVKALPQSEVERIDIRDRRFHVTFKTPPSISVDYIVNGAGRAPGALAPEGPTGGHGNSRLTNKMFANGLYTQHEIGVGVAMDSEGRAVPNAERLKTDEVPELYVASPFLSKGDQYMPANLKRHPLSNTIAESVPGLRALVKQIAKAVVYDMVRWYPDEGHIDYVYRLEGVTREPEYPKEEQVDDSDAELSDFEDNGIL
ncbi:MAG TPA: SidA/IucD/PvdA family monooxygenase [Noviherbaspirillum sp.]|nr:SidA/IucD/PvdA family monooxygenase [Noviherbaspirillum sp.]